MVIDIDCRYSGAEDGKEKSNERYQMSGMVLGFEGCSQVDECELFSVGFGRFRIRIEYRQEEKRCWNTHGRVYMVKVCEHAFSPTMTLCHQQHATHEESCSTITQEMCTSRTGDGGYDVSWNGAETEDEDECEALRRSDASSVSSQTSLPEGQVRDHLFSYELSEGSVVNILLFKPAERG